MKIDNFKIRSLVVTDNFYQFSAWIINFAVILSSVIFIIHFFAPLLGGKLLVNALLSYGSLIAMLLLIKFILKQIKNKVRITFYQGVAITTYVIICIFLWFSYPINILFSFITIVGNILAYRAQS